MSEKDELIGKNLAELRGEISQADIAKAMRERGYKWSQATVWAVERGERPLRLAEADDLRVILGRDSFQGAAEFLAPTQEMYLVARLTEVVSAQKQFEDAAEKYLEALDDLAMTADSVSDKEGAKEVSNIRWFAVRNWLEEHSPVLDALSIEQKHRLTEGRYAEDEMLDYGVKTYRELVEARDKEAQEQGFEDYETAWRQSMRLVGNYSGMREGKSPRSQANEPDET